MTPRRRLLLGLIDLWGGRVRRHDLPALLLAVSRARPVPLYEFIPHGQGWISFQLQTDLAALEDLGLLRCDALACSLISPGWFAQLGAGEQRSLQELRETLGPISGEDLDQRVLAGVRMRQAPPAPELDLFGGEGGDEADGVGTAKAGTSSITLGYEGRSVDAYFSVLVEHGIGHLVDVRKNAFSMKPGFSKSPLAAACATLGIVYRHEPDLGIESEDRKDLKSLDDYEALFTRYEQTTLRSDPARRALDRLRDLHSATGHIALTCFERDFRCCHRSRVAAALVDCASFVHP